MKRAYRGSLKFDLRFLRFWLFVRIDRRSRTHLNPWLGARDEAMQVFQDVTDRLARDDAERFRAWIESKPITLPENLGPRGFQFAIPPGFFTDEQIKRMIATPDKDQD